MSYKTRIKFCKLLLLTLFCGNVFAEIDVELDVVTNVQCKYLYVISKDIKENRSDTIARFDSLSFNEMRASLFYTVRKRGVNIISIVDFDGATIESKPFKVSRGNNVFSVIVEQQSIKINRKNYLYPLKNDDDKSYYVFLLIFFTVKMLIAVVFIFLAKLPKLNIVTASGAFLLSAFIDWLLPINYLWRILLMIVTEFLLIAFFGRERITPLGTLKLVLVINAIGFGIISLLYFSYTFL